MYLKNRVVLLACEVCDWRFVTFIDRAAAALRAHMLLAHAPAARGAA